MGSGLSHHAESKGAKNLFKQIDKDKSGLLEISELIDAAKQYGNEMEAEWSTELVQQLLAQSDHNNDGALSPDEFEHALKELAITHPGSKKKKGKKAKGNRSSGGTMTSAVKAQHAHANVIDKLADEHSRKQKAGECEAATTSVVP